MRRAKPVPTPADGAAIGGLAFTLAAAFAASYTKSEQDYFICPNDQDAHEPIG